MSTVGAGDDTGVGSGDVFEELPVSVDEAPVDDAVELEVLVVVVLSDETSVDASVDDEDDKIDVVGDEPSVVNRRVVVPLDAVIVLKLEEVEDDEEVLLSVEAVVGDEVVKDVPPVLRGTVGKVEVPLEAPVLSGTLIDDQVADEEDTPVLRGT